VPEPVQSEPKQRATVVVGHLTVELDPTTVSGKLVVASCAAAGSAWTTTSTEDSRGNERAREQRFRISAHFPPPSTYPLTARSWYEYSSPSQVGRRRLESASPLRLRRYYYHIGARFTKRDLWIRGLNTTSRIEQATRDLERQFLVSGDAVERLSDLGGFALDDLGLQRLRGRAAAMHVYAVAAKPSTNGQKTR